MGQDAVTNFSQQFTTMFSRQVLNCRGRRSCRLKRVHAKARDLGLEVGDEITHAARQFWVGPRGLSR